MPEILKVSRDNLIQEALNHFITVESILDIGCGVMINPLFYAPIYYCCDPCEEYINVLKDKIKKLKDRIYIIDKMGWQDAVRKFPKQSVDTILLIDVIEHLEKEEGKYLLKETEKIAKKQIFIFTPLDYIEQKQFDGKDAWGLNGVEFQEHKSVWKPTDFGDGWKCLICDDFHEYNNIGEELDSPVGAFFAIKSNDTDSYNDRFNLRKIDAINMYMKDILENEHGLRDKIAESNLREDNLRYQIDNLKNQIKELENQNKWLENTNEELSNKLNNIFKSNGWKVLSKYYRVKNWKWFKKRR